MKSVRASEGQTLQDIAIITCGSAVTALAIAKLNKISVTDALVPGQEIIISDALVSNKGIKQYFKNKGLNPATASTYNYEPDRIFREEFFEEME